MRIGEFIDSLPHANALTDDERLGVTVGLYFTHARDQYGTPLICFCESRSVTKFVRTLRKAGFRGRVQLCC
jgi:hypothetical protein